MKVAQFLPYFPPHKGGVETVAEEFSKYFVSEKCGEVLNITFSVGQKSLQSYEKDGYKVLILPAFDLIPNYPFPKFWKKQFWSVLSQVKNRNPEVIQTHTRFFLSSFLGGICAKLRQKKRVHVEHGSGLVKGLVWRKSLLANCYDYSFGSLVFRLSNAVVAISQANRDFIKKFSNKATHVIYRGLDFPKIYKKKQKPDQISLVFIGRLVKLKGVDLLLSAFSELIKQYPNLHLTIVGSGDQELALKTQAQSLDIQKEVTFMGALPHNQIIHEILPQTDIFINPSLQEGLPSTVIEALLAQTTVVATDVGGTREISSEADLIIVPANNKTKLKTGIEKAIQTFETVSGLSEQCVREKFDWRKGVRQYAEIYKKLVHKS